MECLAFLFWLIFFPGGFKAYQSPVAECFGHDFSLFLDRTFTTRALSGSFRILVKSDQSMFLLWEGQAGAVEKNIFLVCYSNICVFVYSKMFNLPLSYM